MSNPVDHHILPRCYLKGFVDQNGYIWTAKMHDHANGRIRRSSPSGTGYSKNYFTITHSRPLGIPFIDDPLIIEKKLNHFYESKLPKLWNAISECQGQISINTKFEIARTIFHLKMRSKSSRSIFFSRDHIERLMQSTVNELLRDASTSRRDEIEALGLTMEQYKILLSQFYREQVIERGDESQYHNGFLLKFNQQISPITLTALWQLAQGRWTILRCQADDSFILNDNPGNSIDEKNEIFNFFGRDKFEFYFPINSKLCLKIDSFNRPLTMENLTTVDTQLVDTSYVNKVNLISIASSLSEVYSESASLLESLRASANNKFRKKDINLAELHPDLEKNFGNIFPSSLWK